MKTNLNRTEFYLRPDSSVRHGNIEFHPLFPGQEIESDAIQVRIAPVRSVSKRESEPGMTKPCKWFVTIQ